MITYKQGDLFRAETEALVNAVNCVGVMGKGLALQFKQAHPDNFAFYQRACRAGEVAPGQMLIFDRGFLVAPRYLINFPTKQHWKGRSQLAYIEVGLAALVEEVQKRTIRSLALPALGCGNGGLAWEEVAPRIEAAFAEVPEVEVWLFEPEGTPYPER